MIRRPPAIPAGFSVLDGEQAEAAGAPTRAALVLHDGGGERPGASTRSSSDFADRANMAMLRGALRGFLMYRDEAPFEEWEAIAKELLLTLDESLASAIPSREWPARVRRAAYQELLRAVTIRRWGLGAL